VSDSPHTPANTPPAASPPKARCPHCDHDFESAEVIDEWCASCGKKIPEVILKDVRPKPHLRNPLPVPPPTREERAEAARESRVRAAGLFLMALSIVAGLICAAWAITVMLNGESLRAVTWVGMFVLVAFITGLAMLATGRIDN
jgi:hypothetical protein